MNETGAVNEHLDEQISLATIVGSRVCWLGMMLVQCLQHPPAGGSLQYCSLANQNQSGRQKMTSQR
jgi:hypothetical protein